MYKTSEWVSAGHPDKLADFISSFILDRYIERDPKTRYALEVQIKDRFVTLGGEITSTANFSPEDIAAFVKTAVNQVGYTAAYQKRFGRENTICGDDIEVTQHIGKQSPDIAQGVDVYQGIFHGMAVNDPETQYMPKDWWLARKIGKHLYDTHYAGIDIKTQVTLQDDKIDEIVVAVPMTEKHYDYDVASIVQFCCGGSRDYKLVINGTGRYLKHGPVGDCGTTGRKLAVDGISYKKLAGEEYYVQEIFDSAELIANLDRNAVAADHSVYDYIVYDSATVERPFAEALDRDDEVKLFFKIPPKFKVETPIGDYNPDWAVLLEKDGSRKLYFILETKGSTNLDMDVRRREHLKINCGERHFASLANDIEQRSAKTWSEFKEKI